MKIIFEDLGQKSEELVFSPLEVKVQNGNFEEALRRFRQLVQAEGTLKELKKREAYLSPSQKRKRKDQESLQRIWAADHREQMILSGEWEKRQQKKNAKKIAKEEARLISQENHHDC